MKSNDMPEMSVCVCTYKRPLMLSRLLHSLGIQTVRSTDFEIVVVDNHDEGSAHSVVKDFAAVKPDLHIIFEIEPCQGISFARNRAVTLARGKWIAFIDDDETASPNWLADLHRCAESYDADAVLGPVVPWYPCKKGKWVDQSRFFERARFTTGTTLNWKDSRCGNALIKKSLALVRQPRVFDVRFSFSGGEDTDFFRWFTSTGGKIVWCDTAIATEEVPRARQSLRFMLERSFRSSITYWRDEYSGQIRSWRLAKACVGLAGGLAFFLIGLLALPLGLGLAVRMWVKGAKAFGRIAALSNVALVGYGK